MNFKKILTNVVAGWLIYSGSGFADDWPQWRGPRRDDVSTEKGLLRDWPEGGPKLLWRNEKCGLGYSGFSIVGERLYTMGQEDHKQFVACLNTLDGSEMWRAPLGGDYANDWGDGPRCTPTIDDQQVFAISADGVIVCLNISDGSQNWSATFSDFGGQVPGWGYCESPLVDGQRVVCTPGGNAGAILALDRTTGKKIWQSSEFTDPAQYASIVPATIDGQNQYVQLTMESVVGIQPETGKVLWKAPWRGRVAVIPTPIVHETSVYVSSGYGAGSDRFAIAGADTSVVWSNKVMKNHHGGVIKIGDYLFGYSDEAGWVCQDWKTGGQVWSEKAKLKKGAIAYADERLYCVSEQDGEVVLIEPNPEGWKEHGRLTLSPQTMRRKPSGAIWVHPVIANGRLFLRDQEIVYCFDVKKN